MKKAAIVMLSLVLLAAVVAGGGLLWLNAYIRKPAFIEKIQRSLSESSGAQVRFGPFSLNPFTGLDVAGVTMAKPDPAGIPPFLRVERIDVRYAPWSLVHKTVELRKIDLVRPILTVRQSADGLWNLPDFRTKSDASAITIRSGGQQYRVLLNDFNLSGGALTALDPEGALLFGMEDLRVQGKLDVTATGAVANGNLEISALRLGPVFTCTGVRSSLGYADGQITLPDLTGESHGGAARGAITAAFGSGGPLFTMKMRLEKADLGQILRDMGGGRIASGRLTLDTELAGSLQRPRLLAGTGTLSIEQGELAGLAFLQTLGESLDIQELSGTKFDSLKGEFKVGDQKITFYNLEAVSQNIQFTSTGSISFEKDLDFDILLALSPELAKHIPEPLRPAFSARNDGYSTVTFHLFGTLNSPKTNLAQKLFPESALKDLVDPLIDKFLKRGNDAGPAPEPAPAPPATP